MSLTIQDICQSIPQLNDQGKFDLTPYRRGERPPSVAEGLKARNAPAREGLHTFTPEELLRLGVHLVEVNSKVTGYQRPFIREHGRKMAVAMRSGVSFPEISVALDGHGDMWVYEGQHRAVAGVIARKPVEGIVRRMDKTAQRERFANQRKAKRIDPNVLILAGTGPYDRYIQAACTHAPHAWSEIVSAHAAKTRISPKQMFGLLAAYVGNSISHGDQQLRWNEELADGMAPLVSCFGTKATNPLAFRPAALRAIGPAAMYVFRRNDFPTPDDRERWLRHMPTFAWENWLHMRKASQLTVQLVDHWNKRLQEGRRVRV